MVVQEVSNLDRFDPGAIRVRRIHHDVVCFVNDHRGYRQQLPPEWHPSPPAVAVREPCALPRFRRERRFEPRIYSKAMSLRNRSALESPRPPARSMWPRTLQVPLDDSSARLCLRRPFRSCRPQASWACRTRPATDAPSCRQPATHALQHLLNCSLTLGVAKHLGRCPITQSTQASRSNSASCAGSPLS